MTRSPGAIAKDIKNLAKGNSVGEKALRDLAVKIERGHADLAGVDLASAYPAERLLPDGVSWWRGVVGALETVRDVLVFVPVAYTWWKISEALEAFGDLKTSDPFLLAWQKGMDGSVVPLSESANLVALVIAVIVGITVVAQVLRSLSGRWAEGRRRRLAALLAEATLVATGSLMAGAPDTSRIDLAQIGTKIADSSASLQAALVKASTDIVGAVNANPGSALHDMFVKWTAAAAELKELGTRLQSTQEVVAQLRETQAALTAMSRGVTEETERLLAALRDERETSRHEAHVHHELADKVRQSTETLRVSLGEMSERTEQFNTMVVQLQYLVNRLDGADSSYLGGNG